MLPPYYFYWFRIDNKHMTEPWLDQALIDSAYRSVWKKDLENIGFYVYNIQHSDSIKCTVHTALLFLNHGLDNKWLGLVSPPPLPQNCLIIPCRKWGKEEAKGPKVEGEGWFTEKEYNWDEGVGRFWKIQTEGGGGRFIKLTNWL